MLARRVRYSFLPHSLVVSLLLPLISNLVFSRTGGVLSHLIFSTYKSPRFPQMILCSLVTLTALSLVFAATDTVFCKIRICLKLTESKILHATLTVIRSRTPLISFRLLKLHSLPPCSPSLGRERATTTKQLISFNISFCFSDATTTLPRRAFWNKSSCMRRCLPRKTLNCKHQWKDLRTVFKNCVALPLR